MNKILLSIFLISYAHFSQAQSPGEWVWLKGASGTFSTGNYGLKGIPSPLNNPRSLYEPCEWTDLNGNFWLYGGGYNDLWMYSPVTNNWTWMTGTQVSNSLGNFGVQGISSPVNLPPSLGRGITTWVDHAGDLWMFGGDRSANEYSALWKYTISTNEWTWMKGPSIPGVIGMYGVQGVPSFFNNPRSRCEAAAAWTDTSGYLWFFGGGAYTDMMNDLWKYDISTNEWTWMKGSSLPLQQGVYGIKKIEDPANTPGARMSYCRWTDQDGNFWLYGGGDYFTQDHFNDLWKFNPLTNNWVWISGSNMFNSTGNYMLQCDTNPLRMPLARFENRVAWTDSKNNLWMFGGATGGGSLNYKYNDLWMYCITNDKWIWMHGTNSYNPVGYWGTQGVSSPLNVPSGRGGSVGWIDGSDRLYLFGGLGPSNDVWRFAIDTNCTFCTAMPMALFSAPDICPGTCADFTNLSSNATTFQWFFPGGIPSTSTDVNPSGICYSTPGNYGVTLIATGVMGTDTLTLNNYITVFPHPPPQAINQAGDTLIANQGAVQYQWYLNGNLISGATDYFYIAPISGDYYVVATDIHGCEVEAVIFNVLAYIQSTIDSRQLTIFPNPAGDKLKIKNEKLIMGTVVVISVYNVPGEKILAFSLKTTGTHPIEIDASTLQPGMYFLDVTGNFTTFRTKFLKE